MFAEPVKSVKFNIFGKRSISPPPNPLNHFNNLTPKQKKRKRRQLNKQMKKLQMENTIGDENPVSSKPPKIFPTVPPPQTLPPILDPFNSTIKLPPQSPIIENDQENIIGPLTMSNNHVNANDCFARIDRAKSTLDVSEWPDSLT